MLLTRSPLEYPRKGLSARLACVKHAASVRPEPGSNSPTKTLEEQTLTSQKMPKPPHNVAVTQTNLALAYKHPVEFSKNKHTPHTPHPRQGRTHKGQLSKPTRPLATCQSRSPGYVVQRSFCPWSCPRQPSSARSLDSTTGRRERVPVSPGACRSSTLPLSGGAAKSIRVTDQ